MELASVNKMTNGFQTDVATLYLSAYALGVFNPPMNSTYKGGCLSVIRGGKWGSSELSVLRPTPQSLKPPSTMDVIVKLCCSHPFGKCI